MDPATAIGVASATITFADFSAKLLGTAYKIYKSSDGRTQREDVALSNLNDFKQLAQNAKRSLKECRETQVYGSDVGLVLGDVDSICRDFEDLIQTTSSMQADPKVKTMQERLDQLQNRTIRFTLLAIWDETQKGPQREIKFAESVDRMLNSLQRIEQHAGITEIADDEVIHAIHADDCGQHDGNLKKKVTSTLWNEGKIHEAIIESLFKPDLRPLPEVRRLAVSRAQESDFHSAILNGLVAEVPNEIDRREEAIFEPYQNTFSWIFQQRHEPFSSDFPRWLENDNKSPFWITGKPGSGKSTLMKFIVHSAGLKTHLEKWARDFPLQITSFYAWIAGTKLQNSASGFMRTILYQCIKSSSPNSYMESSLASRVAPRRWTLFATLRDCKRQPPWKDWELKEAFDILVTEIVKKQRVMFFVDGLDEFKLLPTDTLDIIRSLCARDGIKVCVASRPWSEFNDALDSFPMLRVQDLTRDDMKKFVEGSFNDNRGFKEQRQVIPEQVDALVQEVVGKANGVFLWSHIVVRDLLRGFTHGDGLPRLAEILRGLPDDIDDLYTRIWRGIDTRKPNFARLLALRNAAFEAPDFLTLWLAEDGHSQSLDVKYISDDRLGNLRRHMVRRLDSATRGILELSPTGKVDFLHRTAMDWASKDEVREEISSHLDSDFDANLNLLQGEALAYIGRQFTEFYRDTQPISRVLRYAHRVGNSATSKGRAIEILRVFENRLYAVNSTAHSVGEPEFFDLMCCYCALPYLEAKMTKSYLMKRCLEPEKSSPLDLAVLGGHFLNAGEDGIPLDIRRDTVKLILDTGAPTEMRRRVRSRVRRRQVKASKEYCDDILALLDAEDKKRWKMSRLIARVLPDKTS